MAGTQSSSFQQNLIIVRNALPTELQRPDGKLEQSQFRRDTPEPLASRLSITRPAGAASFGFCSK